jgi:hypothetical protein
MKSAAEWDSCAGDRQTVLGPDVEVDAAQSTPGIHLVDFSDVYCTDSRCPVMIGGIYVYRDRTHINDEFARTLAPNLRDQLIDDLPELFAGRR